MPHDTPMPPLQVENISHGLFALCTQYSLKTVQRTVHRHRQARRFVLLTHGSRTAPTPQCACSPQYTVHGWGAASIRISQWPTSLPPPLHTHTHTHTRPPHTRPPHARVDLCSMSPCSVSHMVHPLHSLRVGDHLIPALLTAPLQTTNHLI